MNIRIRMISLPIVLTLWTATIAHAAAQPTYYLALGDSLSIGIQPSANGNVRTNQGYADDLYAVFHTRMTGLKLAKLGCSGETTTSMIHGGICSYRQGSQLAAAVRFIRNHHVALVTLDIGADDID
jgi:lysophospholipase L1-like esterase